MAQMIPAQPDADTPTSERKVFEVLRAGLPPDWTVIHARRVLLPAAPGRGPFEGEVDFLVLSPERGYLGLEVKGGEEVGRDADGWYSVSHRGVTNRIKDPGRQAQASVHAIARYLSEQRAFRDPRSRPAYGWGVVFPDFDVRTSLGPELPRDLVIDRIGLSDPRESVVRVFEANGVHGPQVAAALQRAFLEALAPNLKLVKSLAARVGDEASELVRLTGEQMNVLDTLSEIPRIAVNGSAGTGKTLVAMEKARRQVAQGKRVLLLCFNRPLARYLSGLADGFTVTNFHTLASELSRSSGIPFEVPSDPDAQRAFWESEAVDCLIQALDASPDQRWDAVIVDEGQDFREYWWLAVEKLLRRPQSDVLWVFFDPNQNIYGGGPADSLGLQMARLAWNCRNTAEIARYACGLLGTEPRLRPDAPQGVQVKEEQCETDHDMVRFVRKALHGLVSDGHLTTDQVVVLSPHGTKHSVIWQARRFGNLSLTHFPHKPGPNEVVFSSLQRFKGLESDAILLCEVKEGERFCTPQHLYVATSRAKHVLVVARYR